MKKSFFILTVSMLPYLFACAVSPDPVCVRENKVYCRADGNFTGRWYDYYERALSCLEGECYPSALADLDESIRHRFRDQRMARTLGMHFTDYFPHREKGLIHYLTGNYDAAKSELELSIDQYPSAKAFFYLDFVREALMEQEKKAVSLPHLLIKSPIAKEDGIWIRDDPVVISGKAEDEQYVSEIMLNNKAVFMETSDRIVNFRQNLTLDQGRHEIRVTARNLRGGSTEQKIIIHVDRQGPMIILTESSPDGIQGHLCDESGSMSLRADGENIPLPKGTDVPFLIPLTGNTQMVRLLARDRLGNETEATHIPSENSVWNAPSEQGDVLTDTTAPDSQEGNFGSHPFGAVLIAASPKLTSDTATDAGGVIPVSEIKAGPEIILEGWPEYESTVFAESIYIRGQVRSPNNIRELTINRVPVLQRDLRGFRNLGGLFRDRVPMPGNSGHMIFFNHFVRLRKGENRIVIRAEDEYGNTAMRELAVRRKIPRVFQPEHRYCLSVYPFESLTDEGGQQHRLRLFQYFLSDHLITRNRFQVMVRETAHESGPPDLKKLKAPDATLLGNIYETNRGVEIAARVIDIETGEILAIKDAYSESGERPALNDMAEKLSEKFHRAFPLMDAAVIRIQNGNLIIAPEKWIPEKGDIKIKWPLIMYRETHSENPTGSETEIVGEARIQGLMHTNYRAVPANVRKSEIKEGDRIITR